MLKKWLKIVKIRFLAILRVKMNKTSIFEANFEFKIKSTTIITHFEIKIRQEKSMFKPIFERKIEPESVIKLIFGLIIEPNWCLIQYCK